MGRDKKRDSQERLAAVSIPKTEKFHIESLLPRERQHREKLGIVL